MLRERERQRDVERERERERNKERVFSSLQDVGESKRQTDKMQVKVHSLVCIELVLCICCVVYIYSKDYKYVVMLSCSAQLYLVNVKIVLM